MFRSAIFALFGTIVGCDVPAPKPADSFAQAKRSDEELVLDAVIRNITNAYDKEGSVEAFYGTQGDNRYALAFDSPAPWPRGYKPNVPGFVVEYRAERANRNPNENRVLGIRLDQEPRFEVQDNGSHWAFVAVTIINLGGHANGAVAGGCNVTYYLTRDDNQEWIIKGSESIDG